MDYYRHADPNELLEEYGKCLDIDYFIEHHLHYGWHPQIRLNSVQKEILTLLRSGPQSISLTVAEDQLKWPMAAYLIHHLLYSPGLRVAIVASTQREANRRYQGLLYPYDSMPQCFQRPFEMRTCREMHLENGCYVKTFTPDTEEDIKGFKPDVLLMEDLGVSEVVKYVSGKTRVIKLLRS